MKKAFTLIELLVVIAIIAILAAILFPVFAQAKTAAKKTSALSNQTQISLGVILYTADYDDVYPRNDECILNSALNPALKTPALNASAGQGCTPDGSTQFYNRMNHFSWQKWVFPYIKNTDMFFHPVKGRVSFGTFGCPGNPWDSCGQIFGSFALNTAITGALNTYDESVGASSSRIFRNSWTGGTQTALASPSETAILGEAMNPTTSIWPQGIRNAEWSNRVTTVYPGVVRETLINDVYDGNVSGQVGGTLVQSRLNAGGITVGFADGSAKWLNINNVIGKTPTIDEYAPGTTIGTSVPGSTSRIGDTLNLNIDYPFWGLSR
ncbi:MAG: prepilin-type N-terminal cleavage/methylation domain-containing protein [Fimbriimonadaceae bacterium]|nr:prepilin-type N-terminal cleavage/methylation domain-containing protein [Fimbriimonadaceae bacterium]